MGTPWIQIIDFSKSEGLDSSINGADISDISLQTANQVIFDNRCLEKAGGANKWNNDAFESNATIDGIFRSTNKDNNSVTLIAANGKICRLSGTNSKTDIVTGLTANKRTDFINYKDKTLIINGYDDALEFDPALPTLPANSYKKLGLEPLRFYKKVAYMENDETWTQANATVAKDVQFFDNTERTGDAKTSVHITATASNLASGYTAYGTAQDFGNFVNGIAIANEAEMVMSVFHKNRSCISNITVDAWTSANNYYRATIPNTDLDPVHARDNRWTTVKVTKDVFVKGISGTPAWNNINRLYLSVTASASGTAEVYFDNMHWKNPPVFATPYKKVIDNFENLGSADYTIANCTVTANGNSTYKTEGSQCMKVVTTNANSTITKNAVLDLANYVDGVASLVSDEIAIDTYIPTTANLHANSVQLILIENGSKNFTYNFRKGTEIPISTTGQKLTLAQAKNNFTNAGTANWANVTSYKIQVNRNGTDDATIYFDNFQLREATLQLAIRTMEDATEDWTFAGATPTPGAFQTNVKYLVKGTQSIYLKAGKGQTVTANSTIAIDLSQYAASESSGDSDLICWWMYWNQFKYIKEIELDIDVNAADFTTDYYKYVVTPDELISLLNLSGEKDSKANDKSIYMEVKKSDFTRVGSTAGKDWADGAAVKFTLKAQDSGSGMGTNKVIVYFDDLHMRRKKGLNGIYQWCCVPFHSDGTKGAPSGWSNQVTLTGTRALLYNLPLSADSIAGRHFYRKGGSVGKEARLDFTLYDNTTTTYFADTDDSLLGTLLDSEDIPTGTIRVPLGAKWGDPFRGAYILYRDPSNLKRVYYSNTGYAYAWSELQAYDFDAELTDYWVEDDVAYFNTKNGIRRLRKAFADATFADFEIAGTVKHSLSPWSSVKCEDFRAFVSYDGPYLYSGYGAPEWIGEKVKNYFDPATYDIDQAIAFYRKKHLYVSVKTTGGTRSLLDCYLPTRQWRTDSQVVNCFCIYDGIGDDGQIYIGDTSGFVWQFDTGYATNGSFTSKDYSAPDPFSEIVIHGIDVLQRSASSSPGHLDIQFRVDQTLNTSITISTATLTSAYALSRNFLMGIESYVKGSKIGIYVAPSVTAKHFAVQAIKLIGEVSPIVKALEE